MKIWTVTIMVYYVWMDDEWKGSFHLKKKQNVSKSQMWFNFNEEEGEDNKSEYKIEIVHCNLKNCKY